MRILVGKIFNCFSDEEVLAIEIPGFGIMKPEEKLEGFDVISITGKKLRELQKIIGKELDNETKSHMERHERCNSY